KHWITLESNQPETNKSNQLATEEFNQEEIYESTRLELNESNQETNKSN
ncbi:782_t:CDS:1, partial [Gigaspora rosea]